MTAKLEKGGGTFEGVNFLSCETPLPSLDQAIAAPPERLRDRKTLVKPLNDARLVPGYMRVSAALPEEDARFLAALKEIL